MHKPMIPASCRVQVRLYGPMDVLIQGDDHKWGPPNNKQYWNRNLAARTIFRWLIATPCRRVDRGRITEVFWSNKDDGTADEDLSKIISGLRSVIGKDLINRYDSSYGLAGQDLIWLDIDEVAYLLTQAERLDRIQALPLLEAALSLLERGEFLEDESGQWKYGLQGRQEKLHKRCRLWLAEAYEAQGRLLQAELQYEALLQMEWMDEEKRLCQDRLKLLEVAQSPPPCILVNDSSIIDIPADGLVPYAGMEAQILAQAMRQSATQQSFAEIIRRHDIMYNPHNLEVRIGRRLALQALALLPIQIYQLPLLAKEPYRLPPESMLSHCAAGLTACWELRKHEPEGVQMIHSTLTSYLPALEKLAKSSAPSQKEAAALVSQGYMLLWGLAEADGKLERMEAAALQARLYGQLAQDINLELASLNRLAEAFDHSKALKIYQEAVALPDFQAANPRVQGRVLVGIAGKYAACQQEREALSSLNQGSELLLSDKLPDYHFLYGQGALEIWSGLTFQRIGRYEQAAESFAPLASFTSIPGLPERNRVEMLNGMATTALGQRDLDKAYIYLETAEEVAYTIRHEQRLSECRQTLRDMQLLWPQEPRVKDLTEKMFSRQ